MKSTAVVARRRMSLAVGIVIALAIPYMALNFYFPGPELTYALGLALALIALVALWLAGVSPGACGVRLAPLSRRGGIVLALLLLYLPVAVWLRGDRPWELVDALVYAPASALGQELYFRGALLTALGRIGATRGWRAIAVQALAFGMWHLRAFRVVAPGLALVVVGGTGAVGALWGWQTRRDGTLLYAFAQHAAFLIAA
jgi:membrane protease YdiL (CAAX protease family)